MIVSHDYPVRLQWIQGKRGMATSRDLLPELPVASPPEFGGPGRVWSPEHLFVASVASCLMTTFLAISELSKLEIVDLGIEASGHLEREEDGGYRITEVVLRPRIVLARERDRERALRIAAKSEERCLVSRSIRSAVRLEPEVTVEVETAPVGA